MFKKKGSWLIALIVVFILIWLGIDLFNQGDPAKLKGGFKEVATYRNQNNTGPVQIVYIVSVQDTSGAQYNEYGEMMPHFKYGNTKVYYFPEGKSFPVNLSPGDINFSKEFNGNCIALYQKYAMGNSSLIMKPFENEL